MITELVHHLSNIKPQNCRCSLFSGEESEDFANTNTLKRKSVPFTDFIRAIEHAVANAADDVKNIVTHLRKRFVSKR